MFVIFVLENGIDHLGGQRAWAGDSTVFLTCLITRRLIAEREFSSTSNMHLTGLFHHSSQVYKRTLILTLFVTAMTFE